MCDSPQKFKCGAEPDCAYVNEQKRDVQYHQKDCKKFSCYNKRFGCKITGTCKEIKEHTCPIIGCSNPPCNVGGDFKVIDEHKLVCEFREQMCTHCMENVLIHKHDCLKNAKESYDLWKKLLGNDIIDNIIEKSYKYHHIENDDLRTINSIRDVFKTVIEINKHQKSLEEED